MALRGVVVINDHDYTKYVKIKTGFQYIRDNTNAESAGRDMAEEMHTDVTSHQRRIRLKMGPMPFDIGMQLEQDLQGNDSGVRMRYPDLHDGICTRLFYNTSIEAAFEQFREDGIVLDDVTFTMTTIKEEMV